MDWNAQLNWAEEVFAMLVVLPLPLLVVAYLWYIAPRRYARKHKPR